MAKSPSRKDDIATIDIQPLLLPGSIVLASIIIGISLMVGLGSVGTVSTGTNNGGTAVDPSGNPGGQPSTGLTYNDLAERAGVDTGEFQQCVDAREFESEVQADMAEGTSDGVTGTPGFIVGRLSSDGSVNGIFVNGAQPYSVFETAISAVVNNNTGSLSEDEFPRATSSIGGSAVKGDRNSGVAIVEFTDYECPFCQRHHLETYPQIVSNFVDNGQAVYVIRDFPLSFHDPEATNAAIAARCARKVGGDDAYFKFANEYFTNTRSGGQGL